MRYLFFQLTFSEVKLPRTAVCI